MKGKNMKSRVTTGVGDSGATRTLAGEMTPKSHPILEATGQVDSLRAHLALIRLEILGSDHEDREAVAAALFWLLHVCFLVGTEVNDPEALHPEYRKETVGEKHLRFLEKDQTQMEGRITFPRAFIVSASSPLPARVDVAVTVARSLERSIVRLKEAVPAFEARHILAFVNRLSDYLYVLARYLEDGHHIAVDYSVLDEPPEA